MKVAWEGEEGSLRCRWAPPSESCHYGLDWLQQVCADVEATIPIPDFAAHSPLGSGEWFVPWRARWSVLAQTWH